MPSRRTGGRDLQLPKKSAGITRRESLKRAAFTILPAGLARGFAANQKLKVGVIGLSGMGAIDAAALHKLGENVAALCDPDSAMLERRGSQYPKAARYTDFRKMIEKEKLDGVVVATPDHLGDEAWTPRLLSEAADPYRP